MEKIDKLIEASERLTSLLKELKQSQLYEACIYDVREVPGYDTEKKYIVYEIATGKEVTFGYASGLLLWFDLRNIPHDKIYNIQNLIK